MAIYTTTNPYLDPISEKMFRKHVEGLLGRKVSDSISPEEPKFDDNTWVWVEGFKGTNDKMQGYGNYQFELGKRYDMPEDVKIVDCRAGFHLSLKMEDVFNHYDIGKGNRFFKVRALVRKSDLDKYGEKTGNYTFFNIPEYKDKLASKSIEFIEEMSVDEIFMGTEQACWSEEQKKLALLKGIKYVEKENEVDELVELGYSRPFASYVVHKEGSGEVAKAVASLSGLSMDMKALMIMEW